MPTEGPTVRPLELLALMLREMNCSLDIVSGEEFFTKDGRLGVVAGVVFDVCLFGLWSMEGFFMIWLRQGESRLQRELAGKCFGGAGGLWVVG